MLVNFDLRETECFPACRAADHIRLSRRIHAAVEPDQGQISARRSAGLDLQIRAVTAVAQWLEVGIKLGARTGRRLGRGSGQGSGQGSDRGVGDWLDCSRFYCRLQLALQPISPAKTAAPPEAEAADFSEAPPLEARLALRLHQEGGFTDIFAATALALQPGLSWVSAEIAPPVAMLEQAHALDLHLFLPPGSGDLQISDFAVTGVA